MPPTAHHFTPLWPLHEPQQSFRSKHYAPPKKRKRLPDPDDESDELESDLESTSASVPSHDIKNPYRVAGWPENVPLPASSFPHAPASRPKRLLSTPTNLQKELADLKPPLYVPPPDEQDNVSSLRRHHLNVLTTILHTSLLRGDYVRAGRAWGMVLRTDIQGRPLDVRTNGRWGVGAEILLQRPMAGGSKGEHENVPLISDEGFEAAKDYYERLILQFPYQKTNPHAISSLNFYPAMFGLCIFEIQQKCKQALKRTERSSPDSNISGSDEIHEQPSEVEDLSAIKQSELDSATSLAARMDELMLSPPFDTYPPLLQLRGAVALWLVDLHDAVAEFQTENDLHRERASMERARARRCMDRMKAAGVDAPEMIASVLR